MWVNGEKVASFVDGRITGTTNNEYAGEGNGSPLTSGFSADADVLQDGTNTVAVALYQDRETSSDAYFDMSSLTLTKTAAPGEVVDAPPTRVILTPTETPSVSQSFSWLAGDASHTSGQVEISAVGADGVAGASRVVDAYAAGVVGSNPNQHFSATVDGLTPATDYRYRVGLEGSWSDWYEFTTENPAATDFQFIYYGDAQIGLDTTWPEVVKQAEERAPESIGSVHAGDLINTSSNETERTNWFAGMANSATSSNVMAAPGNHEYTGDKLLTAWKANFEYPHNNPSPGTVGELANLAQGDTAEARQYAAYFEHWSEFAAETVYYTDYQGVRFITLNATRDTTFLTPDNLPGCTGAECPQTKVAKLWTEYQAAWLDHILAESPSKWNVVTFHQPVYSTSSGRDEPVLRDAWVPVFEKHNIDLVLMGHDHTYARGFKDSTATDTPGITTGPVYAVSNSGAKHYDLASEDNNVWTQNGATQVLRGEGVTTYQVVDVTADQLVYRSYLAAKTKDATTDKAVGDLYDEVTVTKYATGAKWVTEAGIDAPAGPALSVTAGEIAAGATVQLTGTGFIADEQIELELRSAPVSLGDVTVDANGGFDTSVTIPAATPAGEHTIVAMLANGAEVSLPVTVAAAGGSGGAGGAESDADGAEGDADGAESDADGAESDADAGGDADGAGANAGGADAGGASGGAKNNSLATTGAGGVMPLIAGGAVLLMAGALLVTRRARAGARN